MARAIHKLATTVLGVATTVLLTAGSVAVVLTVGVSDTGFAEVVGAGATGSAPTGAGAKVETLVAPVTPVTADPEARVAPPPTEKDASGAVATPTTVTAGHGAAQPSGDGVWAVVIGIDRYPGSHDLRAAVADARDVETMLDGAGVPETQRLVLLDGDATLDAVRSGIDWLVANAGPEATAMIFFSGHVREVAGDLDGDGEEVDEALVLADGEQVLDGEVAEALDGLRARHTWIAIAGCYGGGFDDVLAPGRVLTGASPEGVLAYENDRFNRTYLVEYMIRRTMLAGGSGSVQEAFAQAVAALKVDYPHRLPVMFDRSGGPVTLTTG